MQGFMETLYKNFIEADRYMYIVKGLGVTVEVTIFAVLLGLILGVIAALFRLSKCKAGKFYPLRTLAAIYIDVIRGTPTTIQLLIIYYVIFASTAVPKVIVAILAFGLNSGAYIAEIVRAGILAVDSGQMEAGRSLGMSRGQTMSKIVMPQAFKNILPALCNEFIVLLKETSISGFIALDELTRGGSIIRGQTYNVISLFVVAIIYLIMTMGLSKLFKVIEGRMRKSDIR